MPSSPRVKGHKQPEPEEGPSKSSGRALKLNNNNISNTACLVEFTTVKFTAWQNIAWIDLSQNELTAIGPVSLNSFCAGN